MEAVRGLGEIYFGRGRVTEAEGYFRQAIAVGQEGIDEADLTDRRALVRLYHCLGKVLWWQNRPDEMMSLGEAGSTLLGKDTEFVEAALMNAQLGAAYWSKGENQKDRMFASRNAQFIDRLPYAEELRRTYEHIFHAHVHAKNVEEALT